MEESEECGWEGNEQSQQQQQQQQQLMCFRIGFILYLLRRKKYHHHHHHHHQHHHHHHHYKTTTAAGDKMTVTYTTKVSNTSFCGFSKLLFRWRGSVFKLLAADLIVYFLLYFSVAAIYRFALRENEKRVFEKIAITCEYFRNVFPISFVLGFYVTIVVQRWWEQYMLIPWPDTVCIMASTYIEGQDERGRMLRRSFARYINLAFALAFSRISPRVARRLSSYQKYIDAGYMTQDERVIFEMMDACSQHHKIWMPLVWASLIVRQARREGRCPDDHGQKAVVTEITNLRYNCGKLQEYHTMSVPLVYTQVVTLATYSYFAFSILGRQFLDPAQGYENHSIDFYVPIFTLFQFVFYVGWLKVAESLLNPFGDDDDDFETTEFLERHLEVSYMIVDNMHKLYPDVLHPPGTRDLAVPLNNVMARSRPVDSPPSKTASFSGQSEGEKSPVVKSLSQCCIQWRRRVSRSRRASPIRHNGDAYLDTYGAVKTPPVLHGISGRPGSPKCSATEQPFFVPSKDIQVTVHTPL